MTDTIFALATAPGRAALAVIRCSGPGSRDLLKRIAGKLPAPRRATVRHLRDLGGEVFDQALLLWFPGPASFTGEDAFELHLHGGFATIQAATETLTAFGARLAAPGEFSRRAFQAGKLSLVQAEAIADLVDAETVAQRRQALGQLNGALDRTHTQWRTKLIEISSLLESQIDFSDEDIPETTDRAVSAIKGLIDEIVVGDQSRRGEQVRSGFRIAVIGAPNAGKSSLFNALVGRDAAIVTAAPGTTRDIIEVPVDVAGYRVLIADTAGLRETNDAIEAEGVRRAKAWAQDADLRLLVLDGACQRPATTDMGEMRQPGDLIVYSKSDLGVFATGGLSACVPAADVLRVSAVTLGGLSALRDRLQGVVVDRLSGSEFPVVTRARHRRQLQTAVEALRAALGSVQRGPELAMDEIRRASQALRFIVGEVGVDDVLGGVFESFCVGK